MRRAMTFCAAGSGSEEVSMEALISIEEGAARPRAGQLVRLRVERGWCDDLFVARSGWRAARVLAERDPENAGFLVAVDATGRVWRMVSPQCVRVVDEASSERAVDEHLAQWARTLGLTIEHSPGCPGIVVPGIGVLIDESLPAAARREKIAKLLRAAGAHREAA